MEFTDEQKNVIAGITKESLTAFVKSEDFTGTLTELMKSAASDVVNKAITAKSKPQEDRLLSKVAELIKEAVPEKDPDDEPGDDDDKSLTDESIRKSKPYRELEKSHTKLTAELEKDRAERQTVEATAFQKERDADLKTIATELRAKDSGVVVDALRDRVSRDDSGDLVIVTKDKEGVETVQTTQEHVEEYLKARPFLVAASDGGGAGSGSGSGGGAGGGGGDEEITKEDLKDSKKYAELRAAGKIPGVPAAPKSS